MSSSLDWLDGADLSQFADEPAPARLPRPGRDRLPQGTRRETWSNTWSAAWWATQTPEQRTAIAAKRIFKRRSQAEWEQWHRSMRERARERWADPEWAAATRAARDAGRRARRTPEQEAKHQARKAYQQALALRRESLGVTDLRPFNQTGHQQKYRYHTPAGVFDRRNIAAQANGVTNTDLVRLCLKDSEPNFWREDMKNRTTYQVWRLAKGSDTWTRYKHIPDCQTEREAQHLLECHRAGTYKGQQFKSWMRDDQFRVIRSDCTYLGFDQ